MKRRVFVVIVAVFAATVMARDGRAGGLKMEKKITAPAIACESSDVLHQIQRYATQNDKEAMAKAYASGRCELLDPGTLVVLEDFSLLRGQAQVRLKGEIKALWVVSNAVSE